MQTWQDVTVNIGVIGKSGAGKSTLINTLRGLRASDPLAAAVDVVQTTMKPTPYKHSPNSNITLWDLPGAGPPEFARENYLQTIKFAIYDCFIIVSQERFVEDDMWLAREIEKTKRSFYFVRTKVDNDVRNDREDHVETHNEQPELLQAREEAVLRKIRNSYVDYLTKAGFKEPFLALACKNPRLYDFQVLQKKLFSDRDRLKREAAVYTFTCAISHLMKEKTTELENSVELITRTVRRNALIPGLNMYLQPNLVCSQLKNYKEVYGLSDVHLTRLSKCSGLSKDTLEDKIKDKFWMDLTMRKVVNETITFMETGSSATLGSRSIIRDLGLLFSFSHSVEAAPRFLKESMKSMEEMALVLVMCCIEKIALL